MKNLRYLTLIVLLGAWTANISQAAQQFRQINAARGRVPLGAPATVGGPAAGFGNRKSGTQFPVIPAGALATNVTAQARQQTPANESGTAGNTTKTTSPSSGNSGHAPAKSAGTKSSSTPAAPVVQAQNSTQSPQQHQGTGGGQTVPATQAAGQQAPQ
jgi:hypothetical protein